MNGLSEDELSTLSDHLVAGPQTPADVVMTRGLALRRHRRQLSSTAVVVAAACVVAVLGVSGVFHPAGRRDRADHAASTTPPDRTRSPASAALLAPCAPAEIPKNPTPAQIPEVLYLVDPGHLHAVLARAYLFGHDCFGASVSGVDLSPSGTPVRSFDLSYTAIPTDPESFPNDKLPHTRLRGHEAMIAGHAAAWVEDGIVWRWNSSGLSAAQIVRAIEALRPDPAHSGLLVPPASFMDLVTVQDKSSTSATWIVDYGTGSHRWSLQVEHRIEAGGPQFPALASDGRLLIIDGRQVFVAPKDGTVDGKGNVGQAIFVDEQGRRFSIQGDLTDRQLRQIIPGVVKVDADSPQVTRIPLVGPPNRHR